MPVWVSGVLAAVGALLLLGSLAARWVGEGPGSTYAGYRLATALRSGNVQPDGADVVYWGLLSVGLGAAAIAGTAPFASRSARLARGLISGGLVALFVLATATAAYPPGKWALGPWLALAGGIAALSSAVATPASKSIRRWRPL